MGRQLRHWTKKVRQPYGAPTSGVRATDATTPGDDDFEAGPLQAWFTQLVKATQGVKQGEHPRVGARVAFFRGAWKRTLGYTQRTCGVHQEIDQAQSPKESSRCSQKERQKSRQESLGLENVENPVMGRTQRRRAAAPRSRQRRRRSQRGGKLFDVKKLLNKTGMEFHWPGYQYMDPAPI